MRGTVAFAISILTEHARVLAAVAADVSGIR